MRIQDESTTWRITYRVDSDGIVIVEVFDKETQKTPATAIERCKRRLKTYDEIGKEG